MISFCYGAGGTAPMYDPLVLFPMLFGGAVLGFAEAVVRRRGLLQTLINILVAEAFALAALLAFNFVPPGPLAAIALYFAPIVGSAVGVMVVLKTLRRERWSTIGELIKTAGGVVGVFVLLFWIASSKVQSSKYVHRYLDYPATLTGWEMAGAEKVTVAFTAETPVDDPRLLTPSAREILAANEEAFVGERYRLRIINRAEKGKKTWTIAPGEGVSLIGQVTVTPHGWRDFIVRKMPDMTVSMEATGTGQCPEHVDAGDCAL